MCSSDLELQLAGVVDVAGAVDPLGMISAAGFISGDVITPMMVAGYAAAYPDLHPADVLSPAAVAKLGVVDTGCVGAISTAYADFTGKTMRHASPDELPRWHDHLAANAAGRRPIAAPIAIFHGEDDQIVPANTSRRLLTRLCAEGDTAWLRLYPGEGHATVLTASQGEAIRWMAARLAGGASLTSCPAG